MAAMLTRALGRNLRLASTLASKQAELISRFEVAGVPEPESSARHLIASVANSLDGEKTLSEGEESELDRFALCRLARMPVQYIIGEWDFRHLKGLKMRPPVFIPRPETEQLAGLVIDHINGQGCQRVLEVGCGSGAISLATLDECPQLEEMWAVDRSTNAVALATENAVNAGLHNRFVVKKSRLTSEGTLEDDAFPQEEIDVIVSNPPYVLRKDLADLAPEVAAYEDLRALDGGADGLDVILPLVRFSAARLKKGGGKLFMEVDPCHGLLLPQELDKLHASGAVPKSLKLEDVVKDFAGKDRFVTLVME